MSVVCSRWVSLFVAAVALCGSTVTAQSNESAAESEAVRNLVTERILSKRIPGMVAAISDSSGLRAIGAAGFRKVGSLEPMTESDHVHIGSCAKAMTSTTLATLVAEGALSWDSKLVEVIPEFSDVIHPDYAEVTLWHLVTHRGRLPVNAESWWTHADMEIKARRLEHVKESLKDAPTVERGAYLYSNLGYVAAACMAEAVTGESWESLIQTRLFGPLGMASAGFGPPGTPGQADQPWGHSRDEENWVPSQQDNPEVLGPAGRVHCSVADWAKFVALQLPAAEPAILDRAALDKLVDPTGEYAAGWAVLERGWAEGKALAHSGSNTMWFTTVWVAPKLDRAFFVAINSGDAPSAAICDEVISELIEIDREYGSGN